MPATKCNYIVLYEGESQVYSSGGKNIALQSPPPDGLTMEAKRIFFITHEPDNGTVSLHELPKEEVLSAEIKYPEPKRKKETNEQD